MHPIQVIDSDHFQAFLSHDNFNTIFQPSRSVSKLSSWKKFKMTITK